LSELVTGAAAVKASVIFVLVLAAMPLATTSPANAIACKVLCGKYRNAATCFDDCDRRERREVEFRKRDRQARANDLNIPALSSKLGTESVG